MEYLISHYNYWIYILLMMIGLYAMLAKNNLVKKVIGMSIFQTAVIVFYVSIGAKREATIPIIAHGQGHDSAHSYSHSRVCWNPWCGPGNMPWHSPSL
jgi:multicomponent Na+:H+ antiporter subunit C